MKSVRFGKRQVNDDLVASIRGRHPPLYQTGQVQHGLAVIGQRQELTHSRFTQPFDIQKREFRDAGLNNTNARNSLDLSTQRLGRAHGAGENIGKTVALVKGLLRFGKRALRTEAQD